MGLGDIKLLVLLLSTLNSVCGLLIYMGLVAKL